MKPALIATALCAGHYLLIQASQDIIPTPETVQALYAWSAGVAGAALFLALETRKVGGLTFLRLGRLQVSFCFTAK